MARAYVDGVHGASWRRESAGCPYTNASPGPNGLSTATERKLLK